MIFFCRYRYTCKNLYKNEKNLNRNIKISAYENIDETQNVFMNWNIMIWKNMCEETKMYL